MGGRRASKGKGSAAAASSSSVTQKLDMLRNFCPDFSETDLMTCLSKAGYNMELAAERLMTGQFKPTKAAKPVNIVSISSVKRPPPTPLAKRAAAATPSTETSSKKRPSPTNVYTSSAARPEKKRPPHVIPPTPAANNAIGAPASVTQTPNLTSSQPATTALLLCERWLVGTSTSRRGNISHREVLELSHYQTGNHLNVRFRGGSIEGTLSRSLSAMLTPLLRVDHQPKLIELRAEALMDDRNIPMGGEVPLKLAVYISAPKAFFALFDEQRASTASKSSSSMYFANQKNKTSRPGSKMSLPETAFAFLQWAEYGDLPEIPDFTAAAKEDDNDTSENSSSEDTVMLNEEDFKAEEQGAQANPDWAKSVNNAESDKSSTLPEMKDPSGFKASVVLRPYQRQALHWMMQREQFGESREELEKELALLSEMANGKQKTSNSSLLSWQGKSNETKPDIYCDCGPVQVSETAKKEAKTLDGESNPVNHPLWKTRYLGNRNLQGATLFYVNELLGVATCHPPPPPKQCSGGILADDMGLGKTVMLLALIMKCKEEYEPVSEDGKKFGPTLVIAPLSLISQWEEEIATKTSLTSLVWYGDQAKGKSSDDDFNVDIVITTYGTMQAELQKHLKTEKSNNPCGIYGRHYLRVIVDEAHCIKNQATLASRACCSVRAAYRWVVTGTIIHNSLDDVFALIKFLQHQPWCENGFWKAAISSEMNRTDEEDATDTVGAPEPTGMMVALGRVRRLLSPVMLRRTKDSLSPDGKPILTLPPVETKTVTVHLTEPEREFYNALLEKSQDIFHGYIKNGTASKSWLAIFSLLARLRMACDHIALTVKSHIDEADWNSGGSKGEMKSETTDVSPRKSSNANSAVDDNFINGLLQKFRASAGTATSRDGSPTPSYSETVAHALNRTIKDNATQVEDECPCCLDTPLIHEACITNCGHIYCQKCLFGVLQGKVQYGTPMRKARLPNGTCPVCSAEVESSKIIVLAKGKQGGYTSSFLYDKTAPSPVKPKATARLTGNNKAARQILDNAVNGAESSKLAAVLRELNLVWDLDPGSKVLIFSQFLGFLDLMETALGENDIRFGRLDGKMSLKQRNEALELFKSGENPKQNTLPGRKGRKGSVMLVSMKAGGVGLNLVAASTVFIVDPWWNQSIEDQCINRIHRIGQAAATVRVRKFVVENSVEERIVELQRKKKHMASEVYSDINADGTMSDTRPTMDDFKMIFGDLR